MWFLNCRILEKFPGFGLLSHESKGSFTQGLNVACLCGSDGSNIVVFVYGKNTPNIFQSLFPTIYSITWWASPILFFHYALSSQSISEKFLLHIFLCTSTIPKYRPLKNLKVLKVHTKKYILNFLQEFLVKLTPFTETMIDTDYVYRIKNIGARLFLLQPPHGTSA